MLRERRERERGERARASESESGRARVGERSKESERESGRARERESISIWHDMAWVRNILLYFLTLVGQHWECFPWHGCFSVYLHAFMCKQYSSNLERRFVGSLSRKKFNRNRTSFLIIIHNFPSQNNKKYTSRYLTEWFVTSDYKYIESIKHERVVQIKNNGHKNPTYSHNYHDEIELYQSRN